MKPIKIFYSYSVVDELFRDELEKHLKMLQRFDSIDQWHFRKIIAGEEIDPSIAKELDSADIILLLLSPDFLASTYCYDIEVERAIELHKNGKASVIPIILRTCDWDHQKSPFRNLEGLPKNVEPISQWGDRDAAFHDVTQGLKKAIAKIKEDRHTIPSEQTSAILKIENSQQEDYNETIRQGVEILLQEQQRIGYNSTREEVEKIQKLRSEIFSKLFSGEIEEKVKYIPVLKEKMIVDLFDKIYFTEELNSFIISEINKIRSEKDTYKWYDRKVIVSAITLSLIRFKKFDQKKINLLIDFLTDFEDKTWQNALTGIVLTLVHHKNKWPKYGALKKRLEHLKEVQEIQDGLAIIESIFLNKYYKTNLFEPHIFELPFFSSVANCFLPFYDNNPLLVNALENNSSEVESEEFIKNVCDLPFLDSRKYSLCLAMQSRTIIKEKLNEENRKTFFEAIAVSDMYNPYQNIVSEYYNFFSYYSNGKIEEVFKSPLSIISTELKTLILDKKNELSLTAKKLIEEKRYNEAIQRLDDLLKIQPEDRVALWEMAICYWSLKKPDHSQSLKFLLKLESLDPSDINVLSKTAICYSLTKKPNVALDYVQRAHEIDPKNIKLIDQLSDCYRELENYDKAIELCKLGVSLYPGNSTSYYSLGFLYTDVKKTELSIESHLEALKYVVEKDERIDIYRHLSSSFVDINDNAQALYYAQMCVDDSSKDADGYLTLGRTYLIGKIDVKLARKYITRANSISHENLIFGNLGHIELCEGNETKAIEYYKKCVLLFDNIKEFTKRFNIDLPYILKYNIPEEKYIEIRDQMIQYWNENYS